MMNAGMNDYIAMGCSLIEALNEKYRDDEPLDFIICVPKTAPGKSDDGSFNVPSSLALNNANISCAGDENELRDVCSRVSELDLADNNLTQWSEVFRIMNCIPNLAFLNLLGNNLGSSDVVFTGITYPKLKRLVLNRTSVTWPLIMSILEAIPSLSELHLGLNGMREADVPDHTQYLSITCLYLNKNSFSDWSELIKIGNLFPNLEQLVLIGNTTGGVPDELMEEFVQTFQNLSSLNVSNTNIRTWDELEQFRWLPSLTDLRTQENPLWEDNGLVERRQLAISLLPNISRLNGTPINDSERQDAERAFIRKYMDQETKPKRYSELEDRYGKLDPLAEVCLDKDDQVSIVVHLRDKSYLRKIDVKWTVEDLKGNLKDLLAPGTQFQLHYSDIGSPLGIEHMKYPKKILYSYKVKDGDEVFIYVKGEDYN